MFMTLPNFLTILRIGVIPFILIAMYINTEWSRWIAFSFYTVAGITDFFDGYLARATGQTSALGRFLDPVADKILVATVVMGLISLGAESGGIGPYNAFAGMVIVLREITVSGLREYLAEIQVSVPVSRLAKWKTAFQILSLGFLIIGEKASPDFIPAFYVGIVFLWVAVILTLVTGYDYLRSGLKHMIQDERK